MLEISEIRKNNLAILVKRHGSEAALNSALGRRRTDCVFNQIKNGVLMTTGKPRALGTRLARDIEDKLGLEPNWMDQDHSTGDVFSRDVPIDDLVTIRLIPLPGGSKMIKTGIYLDTKTLQEIAPGIDLYDLRACIVSDSSMSPTLNQGDRMLIDSTQTDFSVDGVYLLELAGVNSLRRLRRSLDGTIELSMDSISSCSMRLSDVKSAKILGRAIYLWNGRSEF